MIYVGIDDTDTLESPGTNQLAKALAERLRNRLICRQITRHQLLYDPRVPYTSKNGSASLLFEPLPANSPPTVAALAAELREGMAEWYLPGSDPGLCVAEQVPAEITDWGRRCQQEIVDQQEALRLADRHAIYLEGLGGTHGGVIGALAAVGLIAAGRDGRVVRWGDWPDDLTGPVDASLLLARGLEIRQFDQAGSELGCIVTSGTVDVGKRLRPNCRDGRIVLLVAPSADKSAADWQAVRCV